MCEERRDVPMIMSANMNLQPELYLKRMDDFIERLKKLSAQEAREEAQAALKRTGVTDESGEVKSEIVSWE